MADDPQGTADDEDEDWARLIAWQWDEWDREDEDDA